MLVSRSVLEEMRVWIIHVNPTSHWQLCCPGLHCCCVGAVPGRLRKLYSIEHAKCGTGPEDKNFKFK